MYRELAPAIEALEKLISEKPARIIAVLRDDAFGTASVTRSRTFFPEGKE
jgi:hypothetical protein